MKINSTLKHSNRKLFTTSILAVGLFSQTQAAPLPNGTLLGIEQGVGAGTNVSCTSGSCFAMEVAPGLVIWTGFGPGTDGGIIVGKNQRASGQETSPSPSNNASCEMTNAWNFFANFGCFYTPAGASENFFNDTSCSGAGCKGITQLGSLNVAWNGTSVPMGSTNGCNSTICSPEELAGNFITNYTIGGDSQPWSIHYHNVVPNGDPSSFGNVKFQFLARGVAVIPTPMPINIPPLAQDVYVSISYPCGMPYLSSWTPQVFDEDSGPEPLKCFIVEPYHGVSVETDCSGGTGGWPPPQGGSAYFKYYANDGQDNSNIANVIVEGYPNTSCSTPTPTPPPTVTPSPTPTPTPDCIPVPIAPPPQPEPISLSTVENQSVTWGSPDGSCSGITTSPINGTATLTGCLGTYTPFTSFSGNDSLAYNRRCYEKWDGCTTYCTEQQVDIEILPIPTCEELYPQTEVIMIGKGKNLGVEETMTTTFKGHILSTDEAKGKVTICRGSIVRYEVVSTVGTANCTVKHGVSAGTTGTLTDKSKLVCTNKPDGKDTDKFKIKRSKKQDASEERGWFR